MKEERFNKIFNVFILAGMAVCVVLSCLGKMQEPDARKWLLIISAFGALMGVASTVLAANGSIWSFMFGMMDVCIYSFILLDSHMPTQFLLHVLYFAPMEIVGFFQWRKRGATGKKKVKTQTMKGKKWINYVVLFMGVFAVTFGISYFLLGQVGESANRSKMVLDALVTTANIVALVMMAFAYVEQWYLWTMVNISSIVLWTITLIHDPSAGYAVIPLVKYSFYLINGINGIRIWYGLSRKADNTDSCNC